MAKLLGPVKYAYPKSLLRRRPIRGNIFIAMVGRHWLINYTHYNDYCQSLGQTTYVMQWGHSHVWKVGGKVFAIGGWDNGKYPGVTFKVSEIAFEMLSDTPGCRPAPYLASRGMKWIQHYAEPGLSDDELKAYLAQSYRLVSLGLTKKKQKELGLNQG